MSSKHGTHWLDRQDHGAITVVRLNPPKVLDEDTIRTMFELIYSLVTDIARNQLILNLANVDYLPSMALGKLVMLNRKIQAAQGRLALCQLSPAVEESLDNTRLIQLFKIFPTEAEALQSFT